MSTNIGHSPRILITRLSHIGDCVLTLPLACAIKRTYPNSYIGWAVESPTQKLFKNHSCIDELIVIPKGFAKNPFRWSPIKRTLQELTFDLVIDPQSLTKSSLIGKLSAAPVRLGFAAPYGKEFSTILNTHQVKANHSHLLDRTLDFLGHESLGIVDRKVEFQLPIAPEAQESVTSYLQAAEIEHFIALNPGASWASKRWVNKRFGYVAQYAKHAFGLPSIVTWAGEEEREMANEIVAESNGSASLAPATSLSELVALYDRAETFVGCDTGPLHIAAATGTTCVGLHGPTLPTRSGAYGAHHVAVQKWHQNDRNRKRGENLAMRDICVEDVCVALDQVFAAKSQPTASAA